MPKGKKPEVQPAPEPQSEAESYPFPPPLGSRQFDDLVIWQPAEGEPFQIGEMVAWMGSGRHVDTPVVNQLRGMAGEIVSATYCNMFGDVTNRIVRFYADDRVIFVRAAVGELAYV